MARALVLAASATKAEEAGFLVDRMTAHGLSARIVDISLDTGGSVLDGPGKRRAMDEAVARAMGEVTEGAMGETELAVGIGGGTGGDIALRILRALPITFPKMLVTTLPFDPRAAVADNSIILVPTLVDICGLNAALREALENVALMAAGLGLKSRKSASKEVAKSVGVTALGATDAAVGPLVARLRELGREATVFHANGYGGAAFARFAELGAFDAIVDLTVHEMTRLHIAGAHAQMPERFRAGAALPRVVLPGALNFLGLGPMDTLPKVCLKRPHYAHSDSFTHVKLTEDEMRRVASRLADALNRLSGPCAVIVPMGGFSHHDRPGGAIEDPGLRRVCLETLRSKLKPGIPLTALDAHIGAPDTIETTLTTLTSLSGIAS